jgi:UPF0755 protein
VIIERNSTKRKIADKLFIENVICCPRLFEAATIILASKYNLKAGEYEFSPAVSPAKVIAILHSGVSVVHRVTIAEGLTNKQIIEKLQQETLLAGQITFLPEEGWLLPNTYFYHYGDSRQNIINQMHNGMQKLIDELWAGRTNNLPLRTKNEMLVLASIIEKETALESEKPRVAAVFINRLNSNMKLQADPTVVYAVSNGYGLLERGLSKSDLQLDSLFNTYVYRGLPPKPICNPSYSSIKAALHPIDTNDLYFVVNGDGGHNFADNLIDHNRNVSNYRKKAK